MPYQSHSHPMPSRAMIVMATDAMRHIPTCPSVSMSSLRTTGISGAITRTGEYRDRRTKEVLSPPGEQDNADLINAVLSGALQRLVADPELLKF